MKKTVLLLVIPILITSLSACSKTKIEKPKEEQVTQEPSRQVEEIFNAFEKDQQLAEKLLEKGDLKGCEKVKDANMKEQCITNILYDQAMKTKDASVCKDIPSKEKQEICKQLASS